MLENLLHIFVIEKERLKMWWHLKSFLFCYFFDITIYTDTDCIMSEGNKKKIN